MSDFVPALPLRIPPTDPVQSAVGEARAAEMLTRMAGSIGSGLVNQQAVTVNGNNVSLVSEASGVRYREIQIQNLGTSPLFLRLNSGAANTGANGEIVLNAGAVANDGTGGVYRIAGYNGPITGASASSVVASVVVLNLG